MLETKITHFNGVLCIGIQPKHVKHSTNMKYVSLQSYVVTLNYECISRFKQKAIKIDVVQIPCNNKLSISNYALYHLLVCIMFYKN